MNLDILCKVLKALSVVTDFGISGEALSLEQKIQLLARDPNAAQQLNQIIAQPVCADWATFEQVGGFVAQCLTSGQQAKIPEAMGHFNRMANQVATQ